MKKLIISIVLGIMLIFTPVVSATEFNKLIVETDEFTGVTTKTVRVNSVDNIYIISASNSDKLVKKSDKFKNVSGGYTGSWEEIDDYVEITTPAAPNKLGLIIMFENESWEYLRCNTVNFLIDGERLAPSIIYDGTVSSGYVLEYILFRNSEDIKTILEGTDIKFKICNDVYTIPIEELKLLRQVLN